MLIHFRSLQLVLWTFPFIRNHFNEISNDPLTCLNSVEKDIRNHIQQLESKVLSIMDTLLYDQLAKWDAKPPVPSKAFRNISRHIIKLHEAVSSVLPSEQVSCILIFFYKTLLKMLSNYEGWEKFEFLSLNSRSKKL